MKKNYLNKFSLKGKLAFVIGGMGLIGLETSIAIKSAGAKVIIFDIKKNHKLLKNKKIEFEQIDCSNLKETEIKINEMIKKYGCPDIFINCSYPRTKDWGNSSFEKINLENYQKNIKLHLDSYVWFSRVIAEKMKKHKVKGSIILLSSIYGIVGQDLNVYKGTKMRENMTYSVIKGGIVSFTRQISSHYGKYNIRVNAISPGGLRGHIAGSNKKQSKNFLKNYITKVPLKRMCSSEDVASAILFISSDASSYITGSNLIIDGGWSII